MKHPRSAARPAGATLTEWEALVVDAVGTVIEFWRFKRNQGRVWALLYLRGRPMTALELQDALELSKGAVSMVTRELEQWGVVSRVRAPEDASWHFRAETALMKMLGRVIEEREARLVHGVKLDLERAERLARASGDVSPDVLVRLQRMKTLAGLIDRAVRGFLHTARLDVGEARTVLSGAMPLRRPRRSASESARLSPE
ncbi:MAG: MarR family transcriptional regulator [Myxococcales bacterium]|nr:MarR family transcriptional regulator [Myxococcales bacterium]